VRFDLPINAGGDGEYSPSHWTSEVPAAELVHHVEASGEAVGLSNSKRCLTADQNDL
jgi:hypothetical protein